MQESLRRYSGLASILLFAASTFVACGGLDARKVSREPGEAVAGSESSAGDGPGPGSGGSDSLGGGPGNPFGGQVFEGGAPPVVDGPPEVLEVAPVDAAADAEPTGSVSLLFSEGLDAATVTADNVKIMDGDVEVAGELTYSGVVASFEPMRRLSLLASYDVSVSTGVTDIGGTALNQAFASRFTVRDGVWGDVDPAFPDQYVNQTMGIDGRGNALVVWTRTVEGVTSVMGRWYRAAIGWQQEVILDDGTISPSSPSVAVSPEGDAVVAWLGRDPLGFYKVAARRYVSGGWEASQQVVSGTAPYQFDSAGPVIAAIGGGQAVVTWVRIAYYPNWQDYAVHLTAGPLDGAWPAEVPPSFTVSYSDPYYDYIGSMAATVDATGNAIAVFGYYSSFVETNPDYGAGVYYARKAPAGNWTYPVKVPGSAMPAIGPYLASDGDGAMAMWGHSHPVTGDYTMMASRYTKAKQFVAAVDIGDPDLTDYYYMGQRPLVGNATGFFAAWGQRVGASYNAYATRFDLATGTWDALPSILSDGTSTSFASAIGVDDHGNALVALEQQVGSDFALQFARLPAGGAWSAPLPLSPDDNSYNTPILAVAGNGIAAVLYGGGRDEPTGGTGTVAGRFQFFD